MSHANVKLSKNEYALVTDKQVILTKLRVIEKVYALFGGLAEEFRQTVLRNQALLPQQVFDISPKIAKGEQYLQLPYVVLDYPRFYTKNDVLAIRCFFWWGNFFSITLHLAGSFFEAYKPVLTQWLAANQSAGWHIGVSDDAWQHHFEPDNYLLLGDAREGFVEALVQGRNFVKLAKKIPLQQWDGAFNFYVDAYNSLITLLALSCPAGEKAP